MKERVLFIGGPGNISASAIGALLEIGCNVAVFTLPESAGGRLKGDVRFYTGDRNNIGGLKAALDDFKPEIILDFVCFTPQQAQQVLNLTYGKVKQFIFVSTVDVYGYPMSRLPMREDDPWMPAVTGYAEEKKKCEDLFWAKHDKERFPLTVVRPSYSLGATFVLHFTNFWGGYAIDRIREGKPVLVPGDGNTLIHASSAVNTGRMIARTVGTAASIGKSYTCGHDHILTHDGYIKTIGRAAGREPVIAHVPMELLFSLELEEMKSWPLWTLNRFNLAYSIEEFRRDFPDFRWEATLEDGVRAFIEREEKKGGLSKAGAEIIDDKIIKAWEECKGRFTLIGDR
ncbi:MAG: NAD-dependent epimerase/dehydratase family protein [Bacillota bacterium]